MYEHLGTWTQDDGRVAFRVDLWDTGQVGQYGKSKLRYAFAVIPDNNDKRPIVFDGEDFYPSPLHAIDSADTVASLLGFFSAYGESLSFSGDDADVPEFSPRQREALATYHDEIALWGFDLDPEA